MSRGKLTRPAESSVNEMGGGKKSKKEGLKKIRSLFFNNVS